MIHFMKGSFVGAAQHPQKGAVLWVEVQGIGYELLTTEKGLHQCPLPGEDVQVFTNLIVREDAMMLVGFWAKEERDLFNILQNASGVGVKVALGLLSTLTVSEIAQAVLSENFKPLTAAKGVGPKLAQKIVLDLKEKMHAWREQVDDLALERHHFPNASQTAFVEAETVLLSLGYTQEEILRSFQGIQDQLEASPPDSEAILCGALRWLAK